MVGRKNWCYFPKMQKTAKLNLTSPSSLFHHRCCCCSGRSLPSSNTDFSTPRNPDQRPYTLGVPLWGRDTCRHTTKKEEALETATKKCSFYLQAPAGTKPCQERLHRQQGWPLVPSPEAVATESSLTRLTSWISNKKRRSSKHTALQTLTMPTPKQGNVTFDLNDCLIFKVSDFMGLLMRSFPMFSNTGHHSCFYIFPSLSTPLKTPWHQDSELPSEVQYPQSEQSMP